MLKNTLQSRLDTLLPKSGGERGTFGYSKIYSIWVKNSDIPEFATALKEDAYLKLDWLENLSVIKVEQKLIFTYFLRSTLTPHQLVMRSSVVLPSKEGTFNIPSIQQIWPMGTPMEKEIAEFFGAHFQINGRPSV